MIKKVTFDYTPPYRPLFTTKARYIHFFGGRGRGGSYTATQYALQLITGVHYFRGYFMREVFNDIRDSLWRDFKDRIEENETINENDFAFNDSQMTVTYIPTGNTIISKGFKKSSGNRTAKLKSLAGATHVFIEEAEENDEVSFRQLDDSLRTTKADTKIIMVFNPPHKSHWIIKRWYNLTEAKQTGYFHAIPRSDAHNLLSIHSTYHDNLANLNESFVNNLVNYKTTDPDYYYTMVEGLITEGVKGRIFRNWQPIKAMPKQYQKKYGLDFGWNDPTVLIEVEKKDRRAYGHQLIYESGLTIDKLDEKMNKIGVSKRDLIVADNARIDHIEYLKKKGWNCVPCVKPKVYDRVKFMQQFEVFITEISREFWIEYENYAWALDQYKNPIDEPIDRFNHAMDALGYALTYDVEPIKLRVI